MSTNQNTFEQVWHHDMDVAKKATADLKEITEKMREMCFQLIDAQIKTPLRNKLSELEFSDSKVKIFFTGNIKKSPFNDPPFNKTNSLLEHIVMLAGVYALNGNYEEAYKGGMIAFDQKELNWFNKLTVQSIKKFVREINAQIQPLGCFIRIDKEPHSNPSVVIALRVGPIIPRQIIKERTGRGVGVYQ